MTDTDDTDLLAAEYVLGTADSGERALVAARLTAGDEALARAIQAWEGRLACLAEAAPEIEPSAAVRDAVASRLFGAARRAPAPDVEVAALRLRLRRWQAAAAGLAAVAAALLAAVALRAHPSVPAGDRLVAVLQRDASSPAMLVDVDLAARRLTVRALDAAAPAGHAYELWIIDPALGAPRSLGLIPRGADARNAIDAFDPAVIVGATYAVTVEPPGGSPTGRPSGAPVLAGRLTRTST